MDKSLSLLIYESKCWPNAALYIQALTYQFLCYDRIQYLSALFLIMEQPLYCFTTSEKLQIIAIVRLARQCAATRKDMLQLEVSCHFLTLLLLALEINHSQPSFKNRCIVFQGS